MEYFAHGGVNHETTLKSSSHFLQEPIVAIIIATIAVGLLAAIVVSQLSKRTGKTEKAPVKTSVKKKEIADE